MKRILLFVTFAALPLVSGSRHAKIAYDLNDVNPNQEINVIIQTKDGKALAGHEAVRRFGGGRQGRLRQADLDQLANDPEVTWISPDREVSASNEFYPFSALEAVGYRFAGMQTPEKPPVKGTGIRVAVIDSGVSNDQFLGRYSSGCTTSRVVYNQNFVTTEPTTNDLYGHGTHVATILAGDGRCLGTGLQDYSGIAPEVEIVNLRVLDSRGKGLDSWVIAAIDRAIALNTSWTGARRIRVINLSLGRLVREKYTIDPLTQAVERAWKAGITVVVAAGNNGRDNSMGTQGYSTISSPANDPYVITVGATKPGGWSGPDFDTATSYSSKGPTLLDRVVKPDLVAPGNMYFSRISSGSYLGATYTGNSWPISIAGANVPNPYFLSGTSMAAPVVAAAAALVLNQDSTMTPDQVKARLMRTAWRNFEPTASVILSTGQTYPIQHDVFTVGAGYLNLKGALSTTAKIGSTQRALSPRVILVNGKVTMTTSYPNVTNICWGDNTNWSTNIVWGDAQFVTGTKTLTGSASVWGSNNTAGFNICWGDNIIWGDSNPFSEALSIQGDR